MKIGKFTQWGCWVLMLTAFVPGVFGQERYIRQEDKFWAKRVVNRISLIEKINAPLVYHESGYYTGEGKFSETKGIVVSLLNGLKEEKYVAYHPDDWSITMNYAEVRKKMTEFDAVFESENDWEEDEDQGDSTGYDFSTSDGFEQDSANKEDWPFENWDNNPENQSVASAVQEAPVDYSAYEQVIHMVEDWVFDKGGSELVQRIDFFEIIWQDPAGVLPERVLARFRWKDTKEQLDQTMWKSRFNDAESRSIKEVMTLRLFNSIMINVGDRPIRTLHEAIQKKRELIEFEHNLWSY